MEIETHSVTSEDQLKASIPFGIESSALKNTQNYIVAFLKKLLLCKEKIGKNALEVHLNPVIIKSWQDVLSSLEDKNRKLVNIQSGTPVFTLFCPTDNSLRQLQDEKWRIELQEKVDKLLHKLGRIYLNESR